MRLTLAGSLVLIVCNTIKIASARYLARQEKLPALFSLCYFLGIFSSEYFFYLCRILKNATTATILQFISPVYPLLQSLGLSQKRAK